MANRVLVGKEEVILVYLYLKVEMMLLLLVMLLHLIQGLRLI